MRYIISPTNDDIFHSRGPWKKHKYIKKVGNKYIYDTKKTAGKLGKLGKDYIDTRKMINEEVADNHRETDIAYDQGWYGTGRQAEASRKESHKRIDRTGNIMVGWLNRHTSKKASKIINNSKAVKKGKSLISKLIEHLKTKIKK